MTGSTDEVGELLEECASMPYGASQMALVTEVIRRADATGDRRLRFDARMLGSDAYTFGGEPARAFVTFSWCLAEFDKHPDTFTDWDDEQLRWHYKWIIGSLQDFPEIPLARTVDLVDDMQRRYRLGGHSMHAVYAVRRALADHVGDDAAADDWFRQWCAAPRDENSDCAGCDPTAKVRHLVTRGRDEEALALAAPVLVGDLTCHQQPHSILTEIMTPYVRTGQWERAADAHLRGYRGFRDRLADLMEIGEHIEFCGLTGNEVRGLELIERHLPWLDRAPSPRSAMEFATGATLVLNRLVDAGRGSLTVYQRAAAGRPAREVAIAELAAGLSEQALEVATRLDRRNGTGAFVAAVTRRMSAPPLVEYLPLSAVARAGTRGEAGGAGVAASDQDQVRSTAEAGDSQAWGLTAPQRELRAAVAAVVGALPAEATVEDLYARAERAYRVDDDVSLAVALWQRCVQRYPEPVALADRARVTTAAAYLATVGDPDGVAAEGLWLAAVALWRECGDELAAAVAETWLAAAVVLAGDPPRAVALAVAAVDWLRVHGHEERLTAAYKQLGRCLSAAQRVEEALVAADDAARYLGADPARTAPANLLVARAYWLFLAGRFVEAVAAAGQAEEEARRCDATPVVGVAAALLGMAREGLDEPAAAVAAYELALRDADDDVVVDQVRTRRAFLLADSPRAAEVVDELVELVARLVAAADDAAPVAQFHLAVAYHAADSLLEAAEAAEGAVSALDRAGAHATADRCRYRLSSIYVDMGELDQALTLLDELLGRLDGFDNVMARARLHEDAGRLLFRLDRDSESARRFAAAEQCYRTAGMVCAAARSRRARICALGWAGEDEAALAALAEADRLAAELAAGAEPAVRFELAMLDLDAGRLLAGLGEASRAVERLGGAAEALRAVEGFTEALDAELLHAQLLLNAEDVERAEPLLRSVIAGSPVRGPEHLAAVAMLCGLLALSGRRAEEQALRQEYQLFDDPDDNEFE